MNEESKTWTGCKREGWGCFCYREERSITACKREPEQCAEAFRTDGDLTAVEGTRDRLVAWIQQDRQAKANARKQREVAEHETGLREFSERLSRLLKVLIVTTDDEVTADGITFRRSERSSAVVLLPPCPKCGGERTSRHIIDRGQLAEALAYPDENTAHSCPRPPAPPQPPVPAGPDDGGQVYPLPAGNFTGGESWESAEGISRRDWLAGLAMAAWIQALATRWQEEGYDDSSAAVEAAKLGYHSADAMIFASKESTP